MSAVKHSIETVDRDVRRPEQARASGADRGELATYIAQMTGQMAAMARGEKLDLLAYFLDMARIEAATQAGQDRAA